MQVYAVAYSRSERKVLAAKKRLTGRWFHTGRAYRDTGRDNILNNAGQYVFPGGRAESRNMAAEACREFREETGYDLSALTGAVYYGKTGPDGRTMLVSAATEGAASGALFAIYYVDVADFGAMTEAISANLSDPARRRGLEIDDELEKPKVWAFEDAPAKMRKERTVGLVYQEKAGQLRDWYFAAMDYLVNELAR